MTGPVTTEAPYVLLKRGLFERPGHHGYTGVLRHAGRFSHEEASAYAVHGGSVRMMLASEAPAYSPACWHETQVEDLLDLLRIEREAKEAALAAHQQVTAERDAETQRANGAVIRAGVLDMARSNLSYHYHQALDAATNDDLPADLTLTLAERITRYRDRWLSATSELARLRAEGEAKDRRIARLEEALAPFAKAGGLFGPRESNGWDVLIYSPAAGDEYCITADHLRAARAATAREGA